MKTVTFDETTWKLVPVEPTPEMKSAGIAVEVYSEVSDTIGTLTWAEADAIYRAMLAATPAPPQGKHEAWLPIASAPRDGTNILLRFGKDGSSQGKYIPGIPYPWRFIDTANGISWLINHAVDRVGGPSHWMRIPD